MSPLDVAALRDYARRDWGIPERLARRHRARLPVEQNRKAAALRIEVSYASGVHEGPLTGRLFLALSPTAEPEPRIAAYHSTRQRDGRVHDGASVGWPQLFAQMMREAGGMRESGYDVRAGREDGYPRRLWDLETGMIDREVASYMRDTGYDLRHYLQDNWSRIGPDLVGKMPIYNPEMDQFYLPYAVYLLEDFLEGTTDPHYGGEVVHGRPRKGHGWSPFTNAELVRRMADHIAANAPAGVSTAWYEGRARNAGLR